MSKSALTIRLFATLKDAAGGETVTVEVDWPTTVAEIRRLVAAATPALAAAVPSALVAVNQEFAFGEMVVEEGDEVALFPPVSGGAPSYPTYFALASEPPDIEAIQAHLREADVGAVVTFTGFVRGETAREGYPAETIYLEYEAYGGMAEGKMAQIAAEIWAKWPQVKGIAIVQRIGRLQVGDMTTLVACAGGHRDQGVFDAARYGIDRLKEIVPVWKKEVGPDESRWVVGDYEPTESDRQAE
ncbi:MAG TPA: molybdenum cofactor biosynthesis protein MoaE [Anaerolineae bacterium]|nr:molybdenum cofactor biosynthesis protein MoaE [Anaerolineae bacterium]